MTSDNVNHPKHYTSHPSGIECIQVTRHMGFNLGNAIKYIWRADLKADAIEDLRKAVWYLQDEIAERERKAKAQVGQPIDDEPPTGAVVLTEINFNHGEWYDTKQYLPPRLVEVLARRNNTTMRARRRGEGGLWEDEAGTKLLPPQSWSPIRYYPKDA